MNQEILVATLIVLTILGLIRKVIERIECNKNGKFLADYASRFINYANHYFEGKPHDTKEYDWLSQNVDEAQESLGSIGFVAYSAPFGRFNTSHYPILLNTLPQFTTEQGPYENDIAMLESIFKRRQGLFLRESRMILKEIRNPIKWLIEGVKWALSLPLLVLSEFGLLSQAKFSQFARSKFLKSSAGLLSIIGIIETLIGIITGKSLVAQFVTQIIEWIGALW